jgi:hypothetical protein
VALWIVTSLFLDGVDLVFFFFFVLFAFEGYVRSD